VATSAHIAGALLLPPPVAAVTFGAAMLIVQARERARPARALFNTSCTTITVGVTSLTANWFGLSGRALGDGSPAELPLFFLVACINYALNDLLVAGVITLSNGDRFWRVLYENTRYSAPAEFAAAIIGGLVALVAVTVPAWLPAALFPAIIAQLTLRYIAAGARKTAQLQHQALHDLLTDLPNRTLLGDRLQQALLTARHADAPLALLVLDLDRFKEINDTLGHHYGDLLLQQVGPRLASAVRTMDTVARMGGDEFAIVLPGVGAEGATAVAARLAQALERPFVLEGHNFDIGVSIGIALYPEHGEEADVLLRRADVAMYVAKRAGIAQAIYAAEQDPNSADRLALISELRRAIEHDELALYVQPKLDLRSGRVSGVEALVRWVHPRRGLVAPDQFIPLAEQTGLIRSLSRWVLDAALRQCRDWQSAGLRIPVAVNLSMRDLHDLALPDIVAELLATRGVAPDRLRLEITESSLMVDPARAMLIVGRLHAMGVRISIDDFGTGYSSLAYLKQLAVDELKIDRSFVRQLATDGSDAAIVRSTIALAHDLGLTVVAEGVEDRATWDLLAAYGCDSTQGYLVSRPLPASEFADWLSSAPWGADRPDDARTPVRWLAATHG
jgi:diguanylate cyclase (GGDEF)-like protein